MIDIRYVIISFLIHPILITWAISMSINTEKWGTYKIFAEIWIPLVVGIPTMIFVLLFSIQISQERKVLNTNIDQLQITKEDFDRRNKILILEITEKFNSIRNESGWVNTVRNIRNSNNNDTAQVTLKLECEADNPMSTTIQGIKSMLDNCEDYFIKCDLLCLDLNIIDELFGIEIYDIFENDVIWKYKKHLQTIFIDAYTNIDTIYPKIKIIRERKIKNQLS